MSTSETARNWKMRIDDMLSCIAKIQQYTAGMDFELFLADGKTVDAVIRNFEIIGEAANHIPEEIQERYPEIAWLELRGMRNVMIHEYFGVSLRIVWRTIVAELDTLARDLTRISKE